MLWRIIELFAAAGAAMSGMSEVISVDHSDLLVASLDEDDFSWEADVVPASATGLAALPGPRLQRGALYLDVLAEHGAGQLAALLVA